VKKDIKIHWLCTGDEVFPKMLKAIDVAHKSVRLETYIYAADETGVRFRDALLRACKRGVSVQVLVDAFGSHELPDNFFDLVKSAGGEVRIFNPFTLKRFAVRNHRKLLVCDDHVAFIGGFNIAEEYEGDGVTRGWCDLGIKVEGGIVPQLTKTFDEMFALADFRYKRFMRFRKFTAKRILDTAVAQLLLSGPGRGMSPIKKALKRDLEHAKSVRMVIPYFFPNWTFRHALTDVVHRGGSVELILPGKCDVPMSQLAGQSLYPALLRAGIAIHEYQPQILHAKLIIVDDVVYVGSANLDVRSLYINFELMLRFHDTEMAADANKIFSDNLKHSKSITAAEWRKGRSLWRWLKQRWAYSFVARLDPYISRWQLRRLKDG